MFILFFVAWVSPAYCTSFTTAERMQTKIRGKDLHTAMIVYATAYKKVPPFDGNVLLKVLAGDDINGANPRNLCFLTPKPTKKGILWGVSSYGDINDKGELIDGWGRPFLWILSKDGTRLSIISLGENGVRDAKGPDDIKIELWGPEDTKYIHQTIKP